MATKMVRVRETTHATIREIAREQNLYDTEVVDRAVQEYRRNHFFDTLDAQYARLKKSGGEDDYRRELAGLDGTLGDGLD